MVLSVLSLALVWLAKMDIAFSALSVNGAGLTGPSSLHGLRSAAPPSLAAPALRGAVPTDESALRPQSTSLVMALGLAAVAVAAASHRRHAAVTRRITARDIEAITARDVPLGWRPKVSLAQAKKDNLVRAIRKQLEDTFFVMAFNKDGMVTAELEEARAMFPGTVMCRCLKNKLVRKAMQGTDWEDYGWNLKGANMYVFVKTDSDLKPTIEAFLKINKKFAREAKLASLKEKMGVTSYELRPLVGGVLRDEWDFIGPEDFEKLKNFPTKQELIAQIAGSIKQVPTKLAKGIKLTSGWKLAVGIKKITEKMEEEGKGTVAEVAV